MKVKKQISLLLAAALLCTSVGCGRTKTSVVVEDHPVTLRVMTMFGGTDKSAEVYEEIKREYQKAHKNVILEDESRTADEEWKSSQQISVQEMSRMSYSFLQMQQRISW